MAHRFLPSISASVRRGALGLAVGLAGAAAAPAQHVAAFPFDVTTRGGAFGAYEYRLRAGELAPLAQHADVVLVAVPLPDGRTVDLDLRRIRFPFEKVGLQVDGQPAPPWDPRDLTLWKGEVLGEARSEVQLALATAGSYGWIRTGGEVWQLSSFAPAGGSWDAPAVRMWSESAFADLRDPRYGVYCLADRMQAGLGALGQATPTPTSGAVSQGLGGVGTTLECKVAVETDYQYFQRFGNLNAAQNYAMQLLAAVSDRYQTEINVFITYPYLQFWTTSNDPWVAGDDPSTYNSGDLLGELRTAWQGNLPAGANLGHIMSGAGLGGGVAWVDVLCSSFYGFAASTGINGGVNFPVSQGSGNWDFIVFSHEMGHQFGTGHTHNYCPTPLDTCAPASYFGSCQTSQQCINTGTIMSYCHLCNGGSTNVTTYFHPVVKGVMRAAAEASCLAAYTGGPAVCFPDAFEPNGTCATAAPLGQGFFPGLEAANDDVDLYRVTVPGNSAVVLDALFSHAAGDIDARLYMADCVSLLDSSATATNDERLHWVNWSAGPVDVVAEIYNFTGVGCTDYDLRVTIGQDPCQATPDDVFEPNDSCAQAAAFPLGLQLGLFATWSSPDHYRVNVDSGATLQVHAYFSHALGDLDVYLYDPLACGAHQNALARGDSVTDNEVVQWTNTSIITRQVIVAVEVSASSAAACNSYALAIDPGQGTSPGTNFCGPAVPNSTGVSARIGALGSGSVAANDLRLVGQDLPLFSNGYFIVSANAGTIMNPGGAQGHLCLYPPHGRFIAQTQSSGVSGLVLIPVDLTTLPQPTGSVVVQPGETWRFQLWYRDSIVGLATSNFTDAVAVTFQ